MTINLNKKTLDKKSLLNQVSDYEIYSRYIPGEEIMVGRNIKSPFRNESTPSFGFFLGEGGEICFNDFTLRLRGDCVKLVMILYDLSFYAAMSKIAIDFNIDGDFHIKQSNFVKTPDGGYVTGSRSDALSKTMYKFSLGKIRRDWALRDMVYWQKYGISLKTLKKYNVEAISYFIINGSPIKAEELSYVFIETKDGEETYKIYQPESKDYKWLNSHNNSIWQGWNQMPKEDDKNTLIITKSLKDVMCIIENTQYHAVALQCENIQPKEQVISELKDRFGEIIIFYDNDYDKEENWGQIFSEDLSKKTGFRSVCIDASHEAKDFSDLIVKVGVTEAVKILEEELIRPF